MLKELFDAICARAIKASGAEILKFDMGPRKALAVIDGKLTALERPAPPVNLFTDNMEGFVLLCRELDGHFLVTVGIDSVIAYVNRSTMLGTITWKRQSTPAFQLICSLEQGKLFSQSDLIAALRTSMRTFDRSEALLQSVRKIRWSSSEDKITSNQRGEESLSQEILAKMQGVEALSEHLFVNTALYIDQITVPSELPRFTIAVDPVLSRQMIRLQSMADEIFPEIQASMYGTREALLAEFADCPCSVVVGSARVDG